jgi:hypothetical protein
MSFRIQGLSPAPFANLYGLSEADLAARGVVRYVADDTFNYPDRIEMRHLALGETALLLNHVCQPAETPYRATHAIFVREGASKPFDEIGVVPEVFRPRLLSLRAYDERGMMVDADVVEGATVEGLIERLIERLLDNPAVSYIHAHNAQRGCYSGLITRP